MDHKLYMKIADEICNQLIFLSEHKKIKNKTLIELFNELLDKKYEDNKYLILSYIPECLAMKGYEIINSNYFAIKKY